MTKEYIYYYDEFSFTLFINDYWERIYNGKPKEELYPDYRAMLGIVKSVDKNKFILDVGANNGLFCIPAAMMGYKVIGFEPILSSFQNLVKSRDYNNITDLYLYNSALSNKNEIREIYVPECPDNASFSAEAAIANMANKDFVTQQVKTLKFDDWVIEKPYYQNIGLIKIDAQGAEYNIIEGMKEFLTAATNIYIICEYEDHLLKMGRTFDELDDLIASFGFRQTGIIGNDRIFYKG